MSVTAPSEPRRERRRSQRVMIPIRIIASGTDANGAQFREAAHTIEISRYGALIAFRERPPWGSEVVIENPVRCRSARARVVWCGDSSSQKQRFAIAVEFAEPQGIRGLWGIEFPPPDWKARPPDEAGGPAANSERSGPQMARA